MKPIVETVYALEYSWRKWFLILSWYVWVVFLFGERVVTRMLSWSQRQFSNNLAQIQCQATAFPLTMTPSTTWGGLSVNMDLDGKIPAKIIWEKSVSKYLFCCILPLRLSISSQLQWSFSSDKTSGNTSGCQAVAWFSQKTFSTQWMVL